MRKALACILTVAPLSGMAAVNYFENFQGSVGAEWSSSLTTDVNNANRRGLGAFDNTSVTLTLTGFAVNAPATLEFDLYLLDSWDGSGPTGGPDIFSAVAGATTLVSASFSVINEISTYTQTYSAATPLGSGSFASYKDADEVDTLTAYNVFGYGNAVYKFGGGVNPTLNFTPTSSTVVFTFSGSGLEPLPNEGWALDNVRVVQAVPEPGSLAVLALGAAFLRRRRK